LNNGSFLSLASGVMTLTGKLQVSGQATAPGEAERSRDRGLDVRVRVRRRIRG
jgi:hypothetical protein